MAHDTVSKMVQNYMVTALWSSTDNCREDGGDPMDQNYGIEDIAPETRKTMKRDCAAFLNKNFDAIFCDGAPVSNDGSGTIGMAGHDFWLTRSGHGAGFWDGDWPEPQATQLTASAKTFGRVDLYVGDDGKLYS